MQRVTNYRKQNENFGEPMPKRSKSSKCDASITRSLIYEEPTKRTTKENMMPWTKDAMMHPQQGIVGTTSGPLLNKSTMIDLANSADETSNQKSLNSPMAPSCPALPEEVGNTCETCYEKLELFFDDER
ncbi:unnamed protein product [Ceratitis capitata]|uniref:(Mediterranean fruit fly) hypothetical protein n=1 Tax=Ceratitis capitata TaxID=7213 RepID=A0A811UJM3_CERCA|nr:unnamed protein product [Ceratitis capitata]